jgi:hypothetical protein
MANLRAKMGNTKTVLTVGAHSKQFLILCESMLLRSDIVC